MGKNRPGWPIWVVLLLLSFVLSLIPVVDAHTSVERLLRIAPNGTTVGAEGFPRGFWPRSAPGYHDSANTYLIPPNDESRPGGKVIFSTDKIAHPSQRTSNYSSTSPPLKAAPGDMIILQYQENGHTTIPTNQPNKPVNGGTVYIYGTADLDPNANLLDIHYRWNQKGTGGDGKGKLLATRNFDDGQCYQINGHPISLDRSAKFSKTAEQPMGSNLWCQTDLALPTDLHIGKPYTLIWVWDWPSMMKPNVPTPPGSFPKDPTIDYPELYTTVIDINVVDPCDDSLGDVKGPTCTQAGLGGNSKYVVTEKDLNKAAIQAQLLNMFIVDVSAYIDIPNVPSAPSSSGVPSPAAASSPAAAASVSSSPGVSAAFTDSGQLTQTATAYLSTATVSATANAAASPTTNSNGQVLLTTTTFVYGTVTVATTTQYTPSNMIADNPAIVTVTVTTYSATVTETIVVPASSYSFSQYTGTSSGSGTSGPTVTRFLKDSKPTAVKKGRREIGQWGFGGGGLA